MAEGEVVYEQEGDQIRAYKDLGTFDKQGRINELNALKRDKNLQINSLQSDVSGIDAELASLDNL